MHSRSARPGRVRSPAGGFTLIEALITVAVVGILVGMGLSVVSAWSRREGTREAAAIVAGSLQMARGQAAGDGVARLVLFQPQSFCDETDRSPAARIVKDNDRSFSITPADLVVDLKLPAHVGCEVQIYAGGMVPLEGGADALAFPLDAGTLLPAFAFAASGMTVEMTSSPSALASTAGSIYVYNAAGDLFAVVVRPLGTIGISTFDTATGTWR